MKRRVLVSLLLLAVTESRALVLSDETWGETVPVTELDLARYLESRVREAQAAGKFREAQERAAKRFESLLHAPSGQKLPQAQTVRVHRVPMVSEERLSRLDPGLRSQLEGFSRTYLFLDGNVPEQVEVLKNALSRRTLRAVLTAGDPMEVGRTAGVRVWADQGGILVRKFGIESVPAFVELRTKEARVTEFPPESLSAVLGEDRR